MSVSTVTRNYAEALFEIGERQGQHEQFTAAFDDWARLLQEEPRLRIFLTTPKVDRGEKKAVVRQALEHRVPPLFLNFVLVVLDKRRERLYGDIGRIYRSMLEAKFGHLHAEITLAWEPDERVEREIAESLSERLGRPVITHVRVDPAILGGIIVRYGDRVMDGTVRRRLIALRRRMLEAELPENGSKTKTTPAAPSAGVE